jgi:hypothetical protein
MKNEIMTETETTFTFRRDAPPTMSKRTMKTTKLSRSGELYASESDTQQACVKWFRLIHKDLAWHLFAIPNAGKRGAKAGPQMKAEGMRAGVFDLFLAWPESGLHGLWIEMKTPDGKTSKAQDDFYTDMRIGGYAVCVCRNLSQFEKAISTYLQGKFRQEDWPCK